MSSCFLLAFFFYFLSFCPLHACCFLSPGHGRPMDWFELATIPIHIPVSLSFSLCVASPVASLRCMFSLLVLSVAMPLSNPFSYYLLLSPCHLRQYHQLFDRCPRVVHARANKWLRCVSVCPLRWIIDCIRRTAVVDNSQWKKTDHDAFTQVRLRFQSFHFLFTLPRLSPSVSIHSATSPSSIDIHIHVFIHKRNRHDGKKTSK